MLTDTSTMSWRRINPGACANRLRFTTRTLLLVNSVMLTLFVTYLVGATASDAAAEGLPEVVSEMAQLPMLQIPCERDGGKIFIAPSEVMIVRADGHYTQVYTQTERLFCVWPITEASKRLIASGFMQTHRSYLVNPEKVARFERTKDKGRCTFTDEALPPVPVSRSKLKDIQSLLSGRAGATGAA